MITPFINAILQPSHIITPQVEGRAMPWRQVCELRHAAAAGILHRVLRGPLGSPAATLLWPSHGNQRDAVGESVGE